MSAEDWPSDTDLSRWEAVEAEARQRLEGEAESADPAPPEPHADWHAGEPSWWLDQAADRPAPPADAPKGADPAPTTAKPDAGSPALQPDILLADADHAIGVSLEQAMADQGWRVRRVQTGDQALAEFRRKAPDCFVFDYSLPGIGGLDLLRQLAESGLAGDARLIVNSTQTQALHVQRARAMGAHRFLDRPLRSPDRVIEATIEQLAELGVVATADGKAAAPEPMDLPPPEPAPAAGEPGQPAGGLFADGAAPRGPVNEDRPEAPTPPEVPSPPPPKADRPYRSAFGTGGGPPGRVPKLG